MNAEHEANIRARRAADRAAALDQVAADARVILDIEREAAQQRQAQAEKRDMQNNRARHARREAPARNAIVPADLPPNIAARYDAPLNYAMPPPNQPLTYAVYDANTGQYQLVQYPRTPFMMQAGNEQNQADHIRFEKYDAYGDADQQNCYDDGQDSPNNGDGGDYPAHNGGAGDQPPGGGPPPPGGNGGGSGGDKNQMAATTAKANHLVNQRTPINAVNADSCNADANNYLKHSRKSR